MSSDELWRNLSRYVAIPAWCSDYMTEIDHMTLNQKAMAATATWAAFVFGFSVGRVRPFWRRFTNVQDIPSSLFDSKATLRGRCVSASDGDTIRFRHMPTLFHSSSLDKGDKLSETTLSIRICTIDTPETAKFGKAGQSFGEEAKKLLTSLLQDKMVRCRLLQKDQYGRAVAEVSTGLRIWPLYADQAMLKAGLAEVYVGSGAVYGHRGKDYYLALQETARQNQTGQWSLGDSRESAAEYKARTKPQ